MHEHENNRSTVAWVIGASSGIGQATAVRLAADGHIVAVSGRREEQLAETLRLIEEAGGKGLAVPVDVTDEGFVNAAHAKIEQSLGQVTVLVCSAGTNVVQRWWSDLEAGDFARVVDTNLNAVTRCVLKVLPGMRAQDKGQIIVVSSWAGWRYMSVAGAAYGASKTALGVLVESLNDQQGRYGIRATHLVPAEVRTPIFLTRPAPPSEEELARMLAPEQVADTVSYLTGLPDDVCVNELVISSTNNRIYRQNSAYTGEPDTSGVTQ
ncbi:NADP-dependent 3-hydroxy acid dehydrogenase YdfG [Paenarthrobacter nicotinovorans]|uniref:SDR family oxidoreductase n=1 Tax=Paenarthrobacter nicotinovorans TaxID=29320 RepID=UPI00278767A0|nr:SDR family oxidoreductase [Paenarthrobacter nicotinovorans]MDP9936805.1 NADP-dependent 3-hydroxy acid dehydrogenase YdfG [Paenarthrobacter nicotinovorans]